MNYGLRSSFLGSKTTTIYSLGWNLILMTTYKYVLLFMKLQVCVIIFAATSMLLIVCKVFQSLVSIFRCFNKYDIDDVSNYAQRLSSSILKMFLLYMNSRN